MEISVVVLQNARNRTTYDPAIARFGIYPKNFISFCRGICLPMFIVTNHNSLEMESA